MTTGDQPLVIFDRAFFGDNRIWQIAKADETFQLGIKRDLSRLGVEIDGMLRALRSPNVGDAQSLLYHALDTQHQDTTDRDEFRIAEVWRTLGYPEIAVIYQDWVELAKGVQIKLQNAGCEDEYPEVENKREINSKLRKLNARLDLLVADIEFDAADIPEIVCDEFNLVLQPEHLFRQYWIDRIVNSDGFATHEVPLDQDGFPHYERICWLTKKCCAALKAHGFIYKFSFWAEPIGDTRGDLWIQTDRGPLIISDKTDDVSLQSNFPVQVLSLSRKKLFKLRERDVDGERHNKTLLGRILRW